MGRWPEGPEGLSLQDHRHSVKGPVGRLELRLRVPGLAEPGVVDQDRVGPHDGDRDRVLRERVADRRAVVGDVMRQLQLVAGVAYPVYGGMTCQAGDVVMFGVSRTVVTEVSD